MEVLTDRENSHAYDLAAESPEDTGVSGRKNVPPALVQPDGEVVKKLFSDSRSAKQDPEHTLPPSADNDQKKRPGLENTGP